MASRRIRVLGNGLWAALLLLLCLELTACGCSSQTARAVTGTWSQLPSASAQVPPARSDYSAAYDPKTQRLIVFGGVTSTEGAAMTESGETWAYDPATNEWANLHPSGPAPSARGHCVMAYDPQSGKMLLYGGARLPVSAEGLTQTWAYDTLTNTWSDLQTDPPAIATTTECPMIYDPASKTVFMFSFEDDEQSEGLLTTVWSLDSTVNAWTRVHTSGGLPPARARGAVTYDPHRSEFLLLGGYTIYPSEVLNDLWSFDPKKSKWTELHPKGELPPANNSPVAWYDSNAQRTMLFVAGGLDTSETWSYDSDGNVWTRLDLTVAPPAPRIGASVLFDPVSGSAFLYGGTRLKTTAVNILDWDPVLYSDVWRFTPTQSSGE
jgi:N-acetylneuraminic acid mutarotase